MPSRDEDIHRALAHPLRARVLAATGQRTVSPVELAAELAEPLGVVSYHVRVLAQLGLLVAAGTSPRRGALQHHYRAAGDAPVVLQLSVRSDDPHAVADRIRALVEELDAQGGRRDVTMTVLLHAASGTERR